MKGPLATHENLGSLEESKESSDRQFGWVFTAFFTLTAFWPMLHGRPWKPWCAAVAVGIAIVTLGRPSFLHPANRVWMKLSELLSRVMNPVILAIMFAAVFIPSRLILALTKKDPLNRRWEPGAASYWIPRTPPGPEPPSMANQY